MKWKTTSETHAISECGNYHISIAHTSHGAFYEGWFGNSPNREHPNREYAKLIIGSKDKRTVMLALEEFAKKQLQPTAA